MKKINTGLGLLTLLTATHLSDYAFNDFYTQDFPEPVPDPHPAKKKHVTVVDDRGFYRGKKEVMPLTNEEKKYLSTLHGKAKKAFVKELKKKYMED